MGKYIPNLAQTSKPLRNLLSKDSAWIWDTAQNYAFRELKKIKAWVSSYLLEKAKEKVAFLGHVIEKDGMEADPSKVDAIQQMKAPVDVSELRRFLKMVSQMGKYIPNLAQTSKPLRNLLSKDSAWIWDTAQNYAFKEIKEKLVSTPALEVLAVLTLGDKSFSRRIFVWNWSCIGPKTTRW